jgi:hypothetical protein
VLPTQSLPKAHYHVVEEGHPRRLQAHEREGPFGRREDPVLPEDDRQGAQEEGLPLVALEPHGAHHVAPSLITRIPGLFAISSFKPDIPSISPSKS